jgi:hypothetical protein
MSINPYDGWKQANKCLQEINDTLKAFNETLSDIGMLPMHELIIQGFLLQMGKSIQRYTSHVKEQENK